MDCGTCEVVTIMEAPEPVEVTLTITDMAAEMLQEAFGEDQNSALLVGVLSGGCSGYMYDLQIVEGSYPDCQELQECLHRASRLHQGCRHCPPRPLV